jgi:hypothetical protein
MTKKYKCEVCGRKFSSKRGLAIHKAKSHENKLNFQFNKNHFALGVVLILSLSLLYHRIGKNNQIDSYFKEACIVVYYPNEIDKVVEVTEINKNFTNITCVLKNGEKKTITIDYYEYVVYNDTGDFVLNIWEKGVGENDLIIESPLNKTYQNGNIDLTVFCKKPCLWIKNRIDDGDLSRIKCGGGRCAVSKYLIDNDSFVLSCTKCYSSSITSINFEEGTHKIGFKAKDFKNLTYEKEVIFTISR